MKQLLLGLFLLYISGFALGQAAIPKAKQHVIHPQQRSPEPQAPSQEAAASLAADQYLQGIKLGDLPEGKKLLSELQWVTGPEDVGSRFYSRPVFTESTVLFSGMFDTDYPGVRGFKRLLQLKAVSEAGTTLNVRLIVIAYPDSRTGTWKILDTFSNIDVDKEFEFAKQELTASRYPGVLSDQEQYLSYGHWAAVAGRLCEARDALLTAKSSSTEKKYNSAPELRALNEKRNQQEITVLLEVITAITGETLTCPPKSAHN